MPFPFVGNILPTERFKVTKDGYWKYMGREIFTELLNMVDTLKTNPVAGLWLYGTIGYGKSHILAALACYLIAAGERSGVC